jgi:hypothetical protein
MSQPEAEARRTALILAASQAIVGSAAPIALSIGGLVGYYLLGPDKSLATAPITGYNVGVALGALPAAAIIRWAGQRGGFMIGTIITALGGVAATLAVFQSAFWFCIQSCRPGYWWRFRAAVPLCGGRQCAAGIQARAISFVLAGGIITAVLGPQIVIFTRELFAPVMLRARLPPFRSSPLSVRLFCRSCAKARRRVPVRRSMSRRRDR